MKERRVQSGRSRYGAGALYSLLQKNQVPNPQSGRSNVEAGALAPRIIRAFSARLQSGRSGLRAGAPCSPDRFELCYTRRPTALIILLCT